jgi:hypothetical protein
LQVPHIIEACEVFGVADYEIVLIDCEDLPRENRLRFDRLQPELAILALLDFQPPEGLPGIKPLENELK